MWTFEHTVTTKAKVETIWALYSDISTWVAWDAGIVHASLEGPFAAGTRGLLQPEGQEKLPFVLTEVEPQRGFSDLTEMPDAGISIRFDHRLASIAEGTRVTHRVTIAGPNADHLGAEIGAGMKNGIPLSVASLAAMALERERQHGD
ncbi:SRPBCC family protein [Cohnella nanjingensis]|uniref:SRPBCC family protein n=1 Tax=Cohnella nanjingensis TaxID=1387779 RepID=A0A7X0RR70_9BACL|nr:SRPBCC family protein [Cohnella nanjingensis]MBB6672050.1 SRPBCC family protein [Cohnella nanjingensis]